MILTLSHSLIYFKIRSLVKQPTFAVRTVQGGRGGGTGIATASFITFNTSHISLRSGLSACNNCLSPKVPPSDRLVALNLIQSFVEPLDMIATDRSLRKIIPQLSKNFSGPFCYSSKLMSPFQPRTVMNYYIFLLVNTTLLITGKVPFFIFNFHDWFEFL